MAKAEIKFGELGGMKKLTVTIEKNNATNSRSDVKYQIAELPFTKFKLVSSTVSGACYYRKNSSWVQMSVSTEYSLTELAQTDTVLWFNVSNSQETSCVIELY